MCYGSGGAGRCVQSQVLVSWACTPIHINDHHENILWGPPDLFGILDVLSVKTPRGTSLQGKASELALFQVYSSKLVIGL